MPIPSEAGTRQHKLKCLPSTFHHSHSLADTLHFKTFFTLYISTLLMPDQHTLIDQALHAMYVH